MTAEQRLHADLATLARSLQRIERDARKLAWSDERPWRVESHVWSEDGFPVVDLHDLSVKLGMRCVNQVLKNPPSTGAICFITGVGRHSVTTPQLPQAVQGKLASAQADHPQWMVRMGGPGRIVLVTDPEQAPHAALSSLPKGFWWLVAFIVAGVIFALWQDISKAIF